MDAHIPGGTDHPTWLSGLAVFLGYGVVLAAILLVLFVLPYLLFAALA
jgi:hypothetical protein